ncbi:MAG: hypothetical protein JRH07_10730 [Deltaproteobacteria bacterium]|nr:hypothetical protein [Deltaproteobacteria bacterium]MBW2122306.1 hypothetical protein [Deltaproteobacteria bacterium]
MVYLSLVLAVIALAIAILAYQKAGGMVDLKKQIEQIASSTELKKSVESLTSATDTLREKTAEAIEKLETAIRGAAGSKPEEKKPPKRATPRRRAPRAKPKTEAEATEKTGEPS